MFFRFFLAFFGEFTFFINICLYFNIRVEITSHELKQVSKDTKLIEGPDRTPDASLDSSVSQHIPCHQLVGDIWSPIN